MKKGPGMQLTTAAMPPPQDNVVFGFRNSRGQAARWISVPVHATECTRKEFFWRSRYNLRRSQQIECGYRKNPVVKDVGN